MCADGSPVVKDFPSRDDPKYLEYLEKSFLAGLTKKDENPDLCTILRRLDLLEARGGQGSMESLPSCVANPAGSTNPGTGLGLYAGTGARPKLPVGEGAVRGAGVGDDIDPSPADVVTGPLTEALEKLSIAVDPTVTSHKLKGMSFKPEYYVKHVKGGIPLKQIDHTKLSYREMVYGWFCIIQCLNLFKVEGDVESYIGHCKYVVQQAMASQFVDSANVNYDRHVVTNVIQGDTDTFVVGDTLEVASSFHAGNLFPTKSKVKGFEGQKWNKKQSDKSDDGSKSGVLDAFPNYVCFAYNFKRCTGTCSKKHICHSCGGNHRAYGCEEKKSD